MAEGNGINVYRVDRRTGALQARAAARTGWRTRRSWRSIRAGRFLYSVHGDRSEATAFAIDPRTRPSRADRPPVDRRLQSGPSRLRRDRPFLPSPTTAPIRSPCFRSKPDGSLGPYPTLTTVKGNARAAPHRAEATCGRTTSARSPGPLLLRAVQGRRQRHRLSPRSQARRAGRGQRGRGPPRRRAAPYRLPSAQGAGLCHQRARFDDHDLPPGPHAAAQLDAAADRPLDASRLHRLQHRRRDLGRSRRPQRLRLQPRPRQHRRVRASIRAKGTLAPRQWVPTKGGVPRFFAFDPAAAFPLRRQPGRPFDRRLPRRPRRQAVTDAASG